MAITIIIIRMRCFILMIKEYKGKEKRTEENDNSWMNEWIDGCLNVNRSKINEHIVSRDGRVKKWKWFSLVV